MGQIANQIVIDTIFKFIRKLKDKKKNKQSEKTNESKR